jgi:hypothetical protein
MEISRFNTYISSITIHDSLTASSTEIDLRGWAGGMVYVPTGSSITILTWYAAKYPTDTYLPAYDGLGNAVTSIVVGPMAVPIPAALFAAGVIKALGDAAGTIGVTLKS